jgi:hypothetical protein
LKLINKDRDPDLMMVASLDEILFLVDCDRCLEARRTLFKKRTWLAQGGRIAQVKLRGIEGLIAYGLGELESAEMILREAKAGLEEVGLGFSSAMAGLDIAIVLMRMDRREEAIQEGLASADMFLSLSMHFGILASVLLLRETLQNGTADLETLESLARILRRKLMESGWR